MEICAAKRKALLSQLPDNISSYFPLYTTALLYAQTRLFKTIFEKGNSIIEKTYDRDQLILEHEVYDASFAKLNKKKRIFIGGFIEIMI